MATKKKTAKRANPGLTRIGIKLTHSELAELQKRANFWALGNLSAWLRYTGLKYIPKQSENVSMAIISKKPKKR